MHKVYGLTEPDGGKIRYIGVTGQTLNGRLTNHITFNARQAHTRRSQWIVSLREQDRRPGIVLICQHWSNGLIRFMEVFYTYRLNLAGNDLLNCVDVWGDRAIAAASGFAEKYQGLETVDQKCLEELTDFYFRNLGTGSEKNWYVTLVDNS